MSFRQVLAVDSHFLHPCRHVTHSTHMLTADTSGCITTHMHVRTTHACTDRRNHALQLCYIISCYALKANACHAQAMLRQTAYLFLRSPSMQARSCQAANTEHKAGACLLVCVFCASLQCLADALALAHETSYAWQDPAPQLHQLMLLLVCQLQRRLQHRLTLGMSKICAVIS